MENDDELQCPVCFEIPQNQIYQCLNGHAVCGKCCANITNCPQCRVDLKVNGELIRNRVVESLIAKKKSSSSVATQGPSKTQPTANSPTSTKVVWDCPVCHRIPPNGIFQCFNGHSVCHICISKVQICPTCKSNFSRVRNHLAERLLDSMTFPCPWKEQGCNELLPRKQLADHENLCKFRALRFCTIFAGFPQCQFQTKLSMLNDAEELSKVLRHLATHNLKVTPGIPLGSPYNFSVYQDHFNFPGNRTVHYIQPQFLEIVYYDSIQRPVTVSNNNLAILLQKVELDQKGQKMFSLGFVLFTSPSCGTNPSFVVKLFIISQPKPEMIAKFGVGCVPDLSWSIKPMTDLQYREFLKKPNYERPSFTFTLPVSHIQKFYVDANGCFTFSFTFQRE